MQDTNPTEDLLQGDDLLDFTYRSTLMPGWFKLSLGFLGFVYLLQFFGVLFGMVALRGNQSMFNVDYNVTMIIYAVYMLYAGATIAASILFFMQSAYAMKLGLPVLIAVLLVAVLSAVGCMLAPVTSDWLLIFVMLHFVAVTAAVVHCFRIRKQWAEAIVVR
ncbi:hypothetical protein [Chitinophaga caseinilytica]|uniref:Uncharacterized protein n=1 Tax=Chitinophaga caseinilytica TaxID=2267521 RepID=A0ABZ2Z109_9BACT